MPTVRITWTDINADEEGFHIYRDTSPLDLEALPSPLASVGQGVSQYDDETAAADTTYYYAVASFKGSYVAPFDAGSFTTGGTDWGSVAVGDYVEGGVYAGIITYADSRQFRIIAAKDSGESTGKWGNSGITTGANDQDDGLKNQEIILNNFDNGDSEAFYHCRDYVSEGFSDWYLPARNELTMLYNNLADVGHAEFTNNQAQFRVSSEETNSTNARVRRFSDGVESPNGVKNTTYYVRPIRRVPV